MCINPGKLKDGVEIACRECWQCRENRINDWVGRCIAESKTAIACNTIELTYGRDVYGSADHPSAVVLTYSDVQKYFKLLRYHGYPCRYFAVGEYGLTKGRAHWHLIVYWLKKVPPFCGKTPWGEWRDHNLQLNFMHQRLDDEGKPALVNGEPSYFWPHGFSFVKPLNVAAVRYAMKYIQKDIGDMERQGHLAMSKKPPLGTLYFLGEAERWVKAGLAPRDLRYTMDEARNRKGEHFQFMLQGRTAELFLEHFVRAWEVKRPGQKMPRSELLDDFMNPQFKERFDAKGHELRNPLEKDNAFDRKFGERIRLIEKEAETRRTKSVGGIWNTAAAYYRRLADGKEKGQ